MLENMVVKLTERLDEMELKINELSGEKTQKASDFNNITLNPKEQEIFLLLYSKNGNLITYRDISRQLGITEEGCIKIISGIIDKGIPIIKKYFDNQPYIVLDHEFRNLQAKTGMINLR